MLCEWKKCEIHEMSAQIDHIHLVVSVLPRISISHLMGVLKGKLVIKLFKSYPKTRQKPFLGDHFLARGYLQ
jgi:REP-associated tyrosine transposase